MDVITVLVVAILINKSYSQTLTLSPTCFSNGDTLTLNCDTPTINQGITFYQDGTNKGGCVPSVPATCGTGVTQSGTTTSLEISSFNGATNSGSWTCEYGVTHSPVVIIAVTPCVETTVGSIEGTSTPDGVQLTAGLIGGIVVACVIVLCLIPVAVLVSYRKGLFCFATSSKSPAIQREVSADAGSEVKLLPELRNIDNIKSVEWKHFGKTVQTGYENELMHDNGTIPWVSLKDSGFWLCKLNIENATEQNFVIQLNVTVHQYEEEEGMRVQLLNYIKTSQSFQRVQWYHGKSKISGNEKKYQGGTIQVPALFVGKLEKEDAGEYTCEIVLKKATLQIPVELAVKSTNRNSSLPPVGTPGLQTALTATS